MASLPADYKETEEPTFRRTKSGTDVLESNERNTPIGDLEFKSKPLNARNPGQILRYPYEALTDETDYLQIDIRKYDSVATLSGGLTSNGTSRRRFNQQSTEINDVSGLKKPITFSVGDNVATLRDINSFEKTRLKSGQGSILLPMPSNIQDGNSVSYADGNLDGITAAAFKIASTGITGSTSDNIMSGMTEAVKEANNALLKNGAAFRNIVSNRLSSTSGKYSHWWIINQRCCFCKKTR